MFDNLQGLAIGIIGFAIIIGVGSVVLSQFGTATASCRTGTTYNLTNNLCSNLSGSTFDPSTSTQSLNYLNGQLGSSSGGLASYTPVIVALAVGLLFLGAFMIRGKKKY